MRALQRWLVLVLLLMVLALGVLFSMQNTDKAALDLLIIQLPEQRISLWVLLAFVVGGIAGLLVSSVAMIRLKSQFLLLQRRLDRREKELSSLRATDFRSATAAKPSKGGKKANHGRLLAITVGFYCYRHWLVVGSAWAYCFGD